MPLVGVAVPAGAAVAVGARRCDGAGIVVDAWRRPAAARPLCTYVNHGMESDDPAVAAMHLAYAATFDPSVYVCWRAGGAAPTRAGCCLMMPPSRLPLGGALPTMSTARCPVRCFGVRLSVSVLRLGLDRTLAYVVRFPPTDDRSFGAEGAVCVFAGLLLQPYPSNSPALVRKLTERRVRLWEAGDAVRAGFSVCGM
eukprot:jgi/Tetstr1/433435/TSEL_022709.t1